jgi:PEP-CTERM motif-containing protein
MSNLKEVSRFSAAAGVAVFMASAASADPITFDWTGQGQYCGSIGGGGCYFGSFSGTVTIDVIAPGPAGDDTIVYEDIGYASDDNGWVNTSFVINWDTGSYIPATFDGAATSAQYATVVNGPNDDWLQSGTIFRSNDPSYTRWESGTFMRYTQDTSWLNDMSFRTDLGLATGPGSFNELMFEHYFYNWSTQESSQGRGVVQVQTWAARAPTTVPEPASPYLLALGLIGLLFRRSSLTRS